LDYDALRPHVKSPWGVVQEVVQALLNLSLFYVVELVIQGLLLCSYDRIEGRRDVTDGVV
jgi:hypothetical protein